MPMLAVIEIWCPSSTNGVLSASAIRSATRVASQRGVLDYERPLESQLVHEVALFLRPAAVLSRLAADHQAERAFPREQGKYDVCAEAEQHHELRRNQLARPRVLHEHRTTLSRDP